MNRAEVEKEYILDKLSGRLVSLWHEIQPPVTPTLYKMEWRPYTFEEYYKKRRVAEFKSKYKVKTKRK